MHTIKELKQQEKYNNMLKRKNKEISILKDDKEHLGEFLKESNEEIERLNNLLKETSQTLSEQTTKAITLKSENERLNNIINELLKIIVQCKDEINITTYKDMNNCVKWETKMTSYIDILEKAKDIIGSDKE